MVEDRFKFRVFCKNKMYDAYSVDKNGDLCTNGKFLSIEYSENKKIFLQCTGLKDCNGNLIYEGDIIEYKMSNKPYSALKKFCKVIGIVVWSSGISKSKNKKNPSTFNENPYFFVKELYNENDYRYNDWSEFSDCKIIGNKFQNKELMKKLK